MRVQCTICTEQFDGTSNISAVTPCGHTFHETCLTRWLNENMSCPQCRTKVTQKSIIAKLYLSLADDEPGAEGGPDISQLTNQLENVKLELRLAQHKQSQLIADKCSVHKQLEDITTSLRIIEGLHKQELDNNKTLKQQLQSTRRCEEDAQCARTELLTLRKKLSELNNVQLVINSCQSEVDEMVRQQCDISQLATWCSVYKSELDSKKQECRTLRESVRDIKKELDTTKSRLMQESNELASSRQHNRNLEDDLTAQEQQMKTLRKKIEALQSAIESPNNTASSLARRLINESPAPFNVKRPRLSTDPSIDLDTSTDLFNSPLSLPECRHDVDSKPGPASDPKPAVQNIRMSSAASRTSNRNVQDISNQPDILRLNIMRRRLDGGNMSSVFRHGYNGLGGHDKLVAPIPRPTNVFTIPRPANIFSFKRQPRTRLLSSEKLPPLPKLIEFDN